MVKARKRGTPTCSKGFTRCPSRRSASMPPPSSALPDLGICGTSGYLGFGLTVNRSGLNPDPSGSSWANMSSSREGIDLAFYASPSSGSPHLSSSLARIRIDHAAGRRLIEHTYSINDCLISHPSQLTNPFLGLPLEFGKCESCGTAEPGQCEGHFGYIELPVPVYHPSHVSELRQIVKPSFKISHRVEKKGVSDLYAVKKEGERVRECCGPGARVITQILSLVCLKCMRMKKRSNRSLKRSK